MTSTYYCRTLANISYHSSSFRAATEWPICEPGGSYSRPHKVYCDRYFTCQNGQAYLGQCLDGYGFVLFKGCRLLHEVSCGPATKLRKS